MMVAPRITPPARAQAGITLLELMVVVTIIALLAAFGYPSYREYVIRAQRTEGRAALLQYAAEQEKFYLNNNTYATQMSQLRGTGGATFTTDSGQYIISIVAPNPASDYSLVATYQGGGAEAGKCQTFQINSRNETSSGPHTDCWDR